MSEEPIFRAPMRGFESESLILELPLFVASLVAGAAAGGIYAGIVIHYQSRLPLWAGEAIMGGFALIGMMFIFWGASYFAREVEVTESGVKFTMLFSSRSLEFSRIAAVETPDAEATRKTFTDFRYRNLTPAVNGAVVLRLSRGRAWLFNLDDPEAFVQAVERARGSGEAASA